MAYIYKHIIKDTNKVFYIGLSGKDDSEYSRAYSSRGRNIIWKDIVKEYGYEVIILEKNISLNKAKEIEKNLIKLYGRIDNCTGILSNKSIGGECSLGTQNFYTGPVMVFDSNNKLIGKYKSASKAIKILNPKYVF
jgi:hypothetical protein